MGLRVSHEALTGHACRSIPFLTLATPFSSMPYCLQVNPMTENFGLPEMLQHYHSLYPLEDLAQAEEQPSQVFGLCHQRCEGHQHEW